MFGSETQRYPRRIAYASSSAGGGAALAYLRRETFPQLIDPPKFFPRAQGLATQPEWLLRQLRRFTRHVVLAGAFAVLVLIVATTIPAWAALQQGGTSATLPTVRSSIGTTGTAATRVADLSAATFVGGIPFIQQALYLDTQAASAPEAVRFIDGARQAPLIAYFEDMGLQVTIPYLSDTIASRRAIDAAAAEAERRASVQSASGGAVWQGTSLPAGTHITNARVTFYACIGNGFCGNMASGSPVFAGAAACSSDLPFGTRFVITDDPSQRIFVCLDRGALAATWVDVWFYDVADGYAWQSGVGTRSDIIIVE